MEPLFRESFPLRLLGGAQSALGLIWRLFHSLLMVFLMVLGAHFGGVWLLIELFLGPTSSLFCYCFITCSWLNDSVASLPLLVLPSCTEVAATEIPPPYFPHSRTLCGSYRPLHSSHFRLTSSVQQVPSKVRPVVQVSSVAVFRPGHWACPYLKVKLDP